MPPATKDKINILYLNDHLKGFGGGTENHLATVVERLNPDLFYSYVIAFWADDGDVVQRIRSHATEFVHLPVGKLHSPGAVRQAFALRKFIRSRAIDVVQTFHFKSDTYGAAVAKLAGVPFIISSRRDMGDLKGPKHLKLNRICNRYFDKIIAVCDRVQDAVAETEGVARSKMTTIHNGVDLGRYEPVPREDVESFRQSLGLNPDDFVLGCVAHFRPEKGYDVFFEAVRRLRSQVPTLKVVIAGSFLDIGQSYKDMCDEEGLSEFVHFLGGTGDVKLVQNAVDVMSLPATSNEGFSNSVLEAMAAGKPVVATDVGGNREAVVDGETGYVIPPGSPEGLAEAVLKIYRDSDLCRKMGARSRKRVEEVFTLDVMMEKLEGLYINACRPFLAPDSSILCNENQS